MVSCTTVTYQKAVELSEVTGWMSVDTAVVTYVVLIGSSRLQCELHEFQQLSSNDAFLLLLECVRLCAPTEGTARFMKWCTELFAVVDVGTMLELNMELFADIAGAKLLVERVTSMEWCELLVLLDDGTDDVNAASSPLYVERVLVVVFLYAAKEVDGDVETVFEEFTIVLDASFRSPAAI